MAPSTTAGAALTALAALACVGAWGLRPSSFRPEEQLRLLDEGIALERAGDRPGAVAAWSRAWRRAPLDHRPAQLALAAVLRGGGPPAGREELALVERMSHGRSLIPHFGQGRVRLRLAVLEPDEAAAAQWVEQARHAFLSARGPRGLAAAAALDEVLAGRADGSFRARAAAALARLEAGGLRG